MDNEAPTQCMTCRHRTRFESEWCCNKIQTRRDYPEKDGLQNVITVRPGICAQLNPDNDCSKYRPSLLSRVRSLFGAG